MATERSARPADIAEMLGVTAQTVCNWCQSGAVTAVKIGGSWFIPSVEVARIRRDLGIAAWPSTIKSMPTDRTSSAPPQAPGTHPGAEEGAR